MKNLNDPVAEIYHNYFPEINRIFPKMGIGPG